MLPIKIKPTATTWYFKLSLPTLNLYELSAIEYISGFLGKKVALQQSCDSCFRILLKQNKFTTSLIQKKEVYCLLHTKIELIKIATECENTLKSLTKKIFWKWIVLKKLEFKLFRVFFNPEKKIFIDDLDACNHKLKIFQMIIKTHLSLRFRLYAKMQNQKQEILCSLRYAYSHKVLNPFIKQISAWLDYRKIFLSIIIKYTTWNYLGFFEIRIRIR